VAVAILAAATVALFERLTIARNPWITEFFPCFMGGVLAYARIHRPAILPFWMWPACIGILGLSYCATGPFMEWPACLALGFIVPLFRECSVGPASVASNLIARYSYGIYLSHNADNLAVLRETTWRSPGHSMGIDGGLAMFRSAPAPPLHRAPNDPDRQKAVFDSAPSQAVFSCAHPWAVITTGRSSVALRPDYIRCLRWAWSRKFHLPRFLCA
jgi:hypothetical protein